MGDVAGYHGVSLGALRADSVAGCDLYLAQAGESRCILYRERRVPITSRDLTKLRDSGITQLYVRNADVAALHQYLEDHIGPILADAALPTPEKAQVLYECSCGVAASLFRDPRAQGILKRARKLAQHTVDFLSAHDESFECLVSIASRDYYTYTHSVNVMVICTSFAQALGYTQMDFLSKLAEGALLHDVGKSAIEERILKMPGPLSEPQWQVMREHPELALRILKRHGKLDAVTHAIVRHHHEKLDGSGYPLGLSNGAIPRPVRMVTIADVFDALTTNRCYRASLPPEEAIRIMQEEMEGQLDAVYVERFGNFVLEVLQPGCAGVLVSGNGHGE